MNFDIEMNDDMEIYNNNIDIDIDISVYEKIHKFDVYIEELFHKYHNTDYKIFSETLKVFPSIVNYTNIQLYNWYYGNFLSKIVTMVFQPYLYTDTETTITQLFEKRFSNIQILDAIWVCYYLISNRYCDPTIKDYYDETPYDYIDHFQKDNKDLPYDIKKHIKSFLYIFNAGSDIVLLQQYYIKRWYKKYIKKRKNAVSIIEKYWIEYMLNPNTIIGFQKMKQIENHFNSLI